MTAKKDFKRRVRERQARTGESYTTARAHVAAQASAGEDSEPAEATEVPAKPGTIPVIELVDVTDEAAKLGLACSVLASPQLVARVSPIKVLERVRAALLATEGDPATGVLRAVLLRGEQTRRTMRQRGWWEETRRFLARASAGIGGTTATGDMLALQVDDVMVIVQAGYVPHMPPIMRVPQRVFLSTPDSLHVGQRLMVLP